CPSVANDPNRQYSAKYGWVGASVTTRTTRFQVRIRTGGLNVYASKTVDGQAQPDTDRKISELNMAALVTVTGTRNGWYRFSHQGQTAWFRGWHTVGRR
ncbi:MAG: hypothetical protein ACNA8W_22480, partial [Bradymonadaceae bacterium]